MRSSWSAALTFCLLAGSTPAMGSLPAPENLVGLIAKTHAVRHPTPGGFGNAFEFTFVRFLARTTEDGLTIRYQYEWDTARPLDLQRGEDLVGEQSLSFPSPDDADRTRGYQTSVVTLKAADDIASLRPQQFKIVLLSSPERRYTVVDEAGLLLRERNRRYVERFADCFIFQGCVVACLPDDRPSPREEHPVDAHDLDQYVPDCYLIAALVAAVRRDPDQVRSLIAETPEGYVVTFPGQSPIAVPADLDRGPDMIETRALDINARGEVELWPILLERAFLVLRSRLKVNGAGPGQEFQDVSGGDAQCAYYILTGRLITQRTRTEYPSRQAQLRAVAVHLESGRPVMMSTGKWTHAGERPHWWLQDHVYVLSAVGNNTFTAIDPSCGQLLQRIKFGDWLDSSELKRFLFCD
jgi:hypothetical protein